MSIDQGNTVRSASAQKKLNAALFNAIQAKNEEGVRIALESGADANATRGGLSALGRACRNLRVHDGFENAGRIIARLILAAGTVADEQIAWWQVAEELGVLGEIDALRLLLDGAGDTEREVRTNAVRAMLVNEPVIYWPSEELAPFTSHVAPVVFSTPNDAVERVGLRNSRFMPEECQATWLHLAVAGMRYCDRCSSSFSYGNPYLLDRLLALEPSLEKRWFGMTPLHLAALSGNRHAFAALLSAGSDPNADDGHGRVMGRGYGRLNEKEIALLDAARLRMSLPAATPASRRRL